MMPCFNVCVCVCVCFPVGTTPQVIVPDSKLIQHMNASSMVRLAFFILIQLLLCVSMLYINNLKTIEDLSKKSWFWGVFFVFFF
jgi:hypothetical protein